MPQVKLDFSQSPLSKEQIHNWLKNVTPEEIDSRIANALKTGESNDKLDYLTSMNLISAVEKDEKYHGNADFMKIVLGHTAYKESATTGLLAAGYYVENSTVTDTYTVTQRYTKWNKLLSNLKRKTAIGKYI
ncbi:MAG: hypothetical protein FWD60_01305 [Candidatus Azobacteroides sp.]|nr:hypothetical protein [Candidatus Azobacteroides sp.]